MNKVSVIIPIYNASNYLPTTMECLLKQTYSDYEIVAVNDNSTDDSLNILKIYQGLFKKNNNDFIIINRKQNGGLSAAINSGIRNSTGDYYCFPDADDEMATDYISSMMDVLLADNNHKWVRCDYSIVLEEEEREYDVILPSSSVYKDDFYDFVSKYIAHNAWNMIVERRYFEQCVGNEIYDSRLTQEWSLLLPLSYYSNYARCHRKLYKYHIRKKAMSSWQNDILLNVIEHIDGLELLNKNVLNNLEKNVNERINVGKTAVEIYYHLFRYKKYKEYSMMENAQNELNELLKKSDLYIKKEICNKIDNPDMYLRLVFDVLMSGKVDVSLDNYEKYKCITSKSFGIVYDSGGRDLINAVMVIYGQPKYITEYNEYDEEKMGSIPIIGLIQNSSKYNSFKNKLFAKNIICLEYRNVRDSIRGWGYKYLERL